jgi:hypothetical protein
MRNSIVVAELALTFSLLLQFAKGNCLRRSYEEIHLSLPSVSRAVSLGLWYPGI